MTRRERVLHAVRHKQTDFVPYQVDLLGHSRDKVVEYLGDETYPDRIGNHLLLACYEGFCEELKGRPGYWRDRFGVLWNRTGIDREIGMIDGYVLPEPNLAGYAFPEIDETRLRREFEAALASAGDRFVMTAIGLSTFERAWTLRGIENILIDMAAEPDFVDELLDAICEHNLKIICLSLEYPFDGFQWGDDWGQQKGMIMGPRYWRRFIKPRMARMFERVESAGRVVSLHSCGDISEIMPDLIEIGLDIYQTFQPEIYDVKSIKKEYGSDLTFWGGISTQRVLPFADPAEIERIVGEMIEMVGAGGGYIVAPTHGVPGDVPPENIVALVDAFQNQ